MATNSLQSLHHHPLIRRHSISDTQPCPSLFLKPTTTTTTTTSLSQRHTHFTVYSSTTNAPTTPTTPPTTTTPTTPFDILKHHLSTQDFRQADEETRRLLIVLAGEAAQKRGYVFFSEVQFISEPDLITIDNLWRQYSNDKFGYSVQKRIWHKSKKDFTKFFIKLGWMKKLDTEVEQHNYRAFPNEFIWELKDDTPDGHLPLTNALRGIQLLNSILTHPAFQSVVEEDDDTAPQVGFAMLKPKPSSSNSNNIFKTDYSF